MLSMPLDVEKPASFHVPRRAQIDIWCSSHQPENQRTVESFVAETGPGYPISVLGWKYAASRAKGVDRISHQLGDSPCLASAQTTFSCVLDKQTIYQE